MDLISAIRPSIATAVLIGLLAACSPAGDDPPDGAVMTPDRGPMMTAEVGPDAALPRDASPVSDGSPVDGSAPDGAVATDAAVADRGLGRDDGVPPFADVDFCAETEAFRPLYRRTVERWGRQDDLSPPAPGSLLLVGSSSVRRWQGFARLFSPWQPIQRGFGGAQLGEVALFADALIVRHRPAAVAVFAGTNDVAFLVSPEIIVERFRCVRQRIGHGLGWQVPVLWIAITPTPARWGQRMQSDAVNRAIAELRADDPALRYVDVVSPFLATGEPPDEALFVGDRLHLSAAGYALWHDAIRPVVEEAMPRLDRPTYPAPPLAPGASIRIDLGPDDGEDGERTPSPDHLGAHWNNWHPLTGGGEALAGEHLDDLRTTDGAPTGVDLVITGGFLSNGWANGGVRWPDQALLGDLAVGSATGDFVYATGPDMPGGFALRGLDPAGRYTLRIYAGRTDGERRVTEYVVWGAETASARLQVSGPDAGADGAQGNDDDIATFERVQPDPWGQIAVDLRIVEGAYGYVSLIELQAE